MNTANPAPVGGLVITRRKGQSFTIGEDITVTVVKTGDQTRLHVVAPRDLAIVRDDAEAKEPGA